MQRFVQQITSTVVHLQFTNKNICTNNAVRGISIDMPFFIVKIVFYIHDLSIESLDLNMSNVKS